MNGSLADATSSAMEITPNPNAANAAGNKSTNPAGVLTKEDKDSVPLEEMTSKDYCESGACALNCSRVVPSERYAEGAPGCPLDRGPGS